MTSLVIQLERARAETWTQNTKTYLLLLLALIMCLNAQRIEQKQWEREDLGLLILESSSYYLMNVN